MTSTPSSSLAASSFWITIFASPSSAPDSLCALGAFLALMAFFAACASGALGAAGLAGGAMAAGAGGVAGVGALTAGGALGAAGALGGVGTSLGESLGEACTLTIEVDANIASATTPAAMNGRRCVLANDRSKT